MNWPSAVEENTTNPQPDGEICRPGAISTEAVTAEINQILRYRMWVTCDCASHSRDDEADRTVSPEPRVHNGQSYLCGNGG